MYFYVQHLAVNVSHWVRTDGGCSCSRITSLPIAHTHACTHTHSHYARTGLPVKGNQIQKGSSQRVLKVDSTCRDLRITSGFTLVQQNKCTEQFKQKRAFVFNGAAIRLNSKHVFALEKGANSVAQTLTPPVDSS